MTTWLIDKSALVRLAVSTDAELADLTVLYLDRDFELIGAVTGQPVERLAL